MKSGVSFSRTISSYGETKMSLIGFHDFLEILQHAGDVVRTFNNIMLFVGMWYSGTH